MFSWFPREKMCKEIQQNAFTFHHIMTKWNKKLSGVMQHEATRIKGKVFIKFCATTTGLFLVLKHD